MIDRCRDPRLLLLLVSTSLLSACGGGDGDTGDLSKPSIGAAPPPQPASVLAQFFVASFATLESEATRLRNSARYSVQDIDFLYDYDGDGRADRGEPVINAFPLASSRIEYAHAAGLSGAGATVAILDGGFRATHEAIAGRVAQVVSNNGADTDHGTAVASVVAGDSSTMIGVAPGAQLILGAYGTDAQNARLMRRAIDAGAVAVNNSWGFPGLLANGSDFKGFAADYPRYLDSLRDYGRDGVTVFALPNETRGPTTLMEALPAFVPELEAGWISVANGEAVFDNTSILSANLVSAPCGVTARWCLAAEGTWYAAVGGSNSAYEEVHGTSFAAPMVSGALALLAEAFPSLTPHQLRVRLLASANDDFRGFVADGTVELADGFVKAYSETWGHGFLDLRAALLPIGTPTSRMADGTELRLDEPLVVTGGAVGDAVARSLGSTHMLATDALGGDFRVNAAALVVQGAAVSAGDRLAAMLPQGNGRGAVFAEYGGANLSFQAGETELSVILPDAGGEAGLSVGRSIPAGNGSLYLGVNVTQDDGRLLPVGPDGATSRLAALEVGFTQDTGSAFWSLGGGIGVADGSDMGPLAPSSLTLNSLRAEVGQRDVLAKGDRLSLSLAMPMAVVSGRAEIALPRTRAAGGIVYDPVAIDFAPESREVNLSLVYGREIAEGADLVLGAIQSFNHGHVAGQRDSAATVGLRVRF